MRIKKSDKSFVNNLAQDPLNKWLFKKKNNNWYGGFEGD